MIWQLRGVVLGGVALLIAAAWTPAWTPALAPLTLRPESRITFDGKSTVKDWSCQAATITASIDADPGAIAAVLQARKAVKTVTLTFPVEQLDCANGTMNGHMRKALNAEKHKAMVFTLSGYELIGAGPVAGTLNGTLQINGVTKPITLQAQFTEAPNGGLRMVGSYPLTMTAWQVVPPTLMLGTLKVDPVVTVRFDVQLQP